MTSHSVTLTIDGREVRCPAGWTIYQAATFAGIHIPIFCHHPKLVPVGACRTCLVEVGGVRGLQTSCTAPVREGMVVKVHTSPAAVKARRAMIEFLLTNHPLDCPVCDKGGECPLQDQAMADGPGLSRYVESKRHKNKRYPLGELIVLDQERCVLCWRCIRFLDEWAGDHELDLFGRGAATRLDTFPGRPLKSRWQGNTIDICPVGALTSRTFRFEARVWELTNTPTVCPLCSVGCNIQLGVRNNRLCRIVPRENVEVNDAWICDRGRFAHGFVDHPDRLKVPLVRREGRLEPATWGDALELVARRLAAIAQEHGPQAIAGLGSTRVSNEANYLFQRFLRSVVGSNSVDHLGRMPAGAVPLSSIQELEHKDAVLLLWLDPGTEVPLLELWLKKAIFRHGAKVVVAHPLRIELLRHGGSWLSFRPGSEVTLLNGLALALLEAGLAGQKRASNVDDYRDWLQDYRPDVVEKVTGVPARALVEAAQLLARAERPILLYGARFSVAPDVTRLPPGQGLVPTPCSLSLRPEGGLSRIQSAVANLSLLLGGAETAFVAEDNNTLGAVQMGCVPDLLPGGQPLDDLKIRSRLAGFWGGRLSPVKGLDFDGMMQAAGEGALHAVWIMGSDPATESRLAGQVLGRVQFLVVQDLFVTETASMAEVVLPAASFAEIDGTFVNLTGRLQAARMARRPPGQARPDWWIVASVAKRMVDGKREAAWELADAAEVRAEISKVVPEYRDLAARAGDRTQQWREHGLQLPLSPALARRALVRIEPGPAVEEPDFPLILTTGRLFYDRGTLLSHTERIQRLVPEPFVVVHPADARRLGLAEGDDVWVVSAVGRLEFTLRVSDGVVPGVAFVPSNLSAAPLSALFPTRQALTRVRIQK